MNLFHQEIWKKLQSFAKQDKLGFDVAKYLGSPSEYLNLSTGEYKKVIGEWAKDHKEISIKEFLDLLHSLNDGQTFQEKATVGELLLDFPKFRKQLDPNELDSWLENRKGWCEIDVLCQSCFDAEDILEQWEKWEKLLKEFRDSPNISKRRASLVLLTKSVRKSADDRLKRLSFENIEALEREREILITKAVSWLLRSLTKHHAKDVALYLEQHKSTLPAIAYRETKKKLETGRKN